MSARAIATPDFSRFARRLTYYAALVRLYGRVGLFAEHDCFVVFGGARRALERHGKVPVLDARILEVGCGHRFPATLLFHNLGANVVGIDSSPTRSSQPWREINQRLRSDGLGSAVKAVGRRVAWDKRYYRHLEEAFGRPLRFEGIDVRQMDARVLAFEDHSFDFVFSNAVFEHIRDIDKATSELARVLAPGGVAQIGVHLFPSLSGGHCPAWAYPDQEVPRSVPAWDHLRMQRYPAPIFLNRLREAEYLDTFERHLTVLRVDRDHEGERLLTKEIVDELPNFSRDDLLTRRLTVVLRKDC